LKIDLVMWTYNSANSLEKSLPSIDKAIDRENVCHKIAIDGGSVDESRTILSKYGWTVKAAERKGIPYQANEALALVDTQFFAAFEHDIILNPNWFDRTSQMVLSDDRTGAAQGLRLYVGSKTMQAFEEWMYRAKRIPAWSFSIDNTLFRTDAVRRAGGFPIEDPASADTILRKNLFRLGYRWVTDNALLSGHYRKDFLEQFKHQVKLFELARYYWSSSPEDRSIPRRFISLLGGNPTHVLEMAFESRMLRVPILWYILRLQRGLYLAFPRKNKAARRVPMDDWYLTAFLRTVMSSRNSLREADGIDSSSSTGKKCAWCGKTAEYTYSVPPDWGNVLPKLHPGIARRFFACSNSHAEKIAERIFKDAFDYVTSFRTEAIE
jgi:glycosyltransferase involved in cell wall biosynthesis